MDVPCWLNISDLFLVFHYRCMASWWKLKPRFPRSEETVPLLSLNVLFTTWYCHFVSCITPRQNSAAIRNHYENTTEIAWLCYCVSFHVRFCSIRAHTHKTECFKEQRLIWGSLNSRSLILITWLTPATYIHYYIVCIWLKWLLPFHIIICIIICFYIIIILLLFIYYFIITYHFYIIIQNVIYSIK